MPRPKRRERRPKIADIRWTTTSPRSMHCLNFPALRMTAFALPHRAIQVNCHPACSSSGSTQLLAARPALPLEFCSRRRHACGMAEPRTPLPPFAALRAFHAAAVHGRFRAAALSLGVTELAISHQVRRLEDFLRTALFDRSGRASV